jgi:hypothetical protein
LRLEGKAIAVEPDALVLSVKKSGDPQAYPKGQNSIPRSSLSELRLIERNDIGRLVGYEIQKIQVGHALCGLVIELNKQFVAKWTL